MKPFAALSARDKAIEVVRWLCVPVAAALAVSLFIFIGSLAIPRVYAQLPGSPVAPPGILRVVTIRTFSALMAASFVLAGAKMAPRYRAIVASVLAAMWIGLSFMSHIVIHLGQGTPLYFDFALAIAAVAAAIALIHYTEKPRRSPANPDS
jgi:hypothetical protein